MVRDNGKKKRKRRYKTISLDMSLWCPVCSKLTPHKRITYKNFNRWKKGFQTNRSAKVKCQSCGLCTKYRTKTLALNPQIKTENVMRITPESYYNDILQRLFT